MVVEIVDQETGPKRKRYNKNKKKAWRKKTDISEVEQKLEDERREERYGGPLEEREDAEMLFVDLGDGGDDGFQTQQASEDFTLEYTVDEANEDSGNMKLKPRKVKHKVKTLKTHQFINGLPGVKAVRKSRKTEGALTKAMKKKEKLQNKDSKIAKKVKQIIEQVAENAQRDVKKPKYVIKSKFTSDIWTEGADDVTQECKKKGLEDSFIGSISDYYRRERRMKPVKVPQNRQFPSSKLDAVTVPHAGTSYNPTYVSHQELLLKAVKQEEKHIRSNARVERATTKMFPTIDKAPTEETWLNEMSEGLPTVNDENEASEQEEEEKVKVKEVSNENITVSSKPKNERKTKKDRKKERKQKLSKVKKIQKKEERIRSSNIYKLKVYQKEMDKAEKLAQKRMISRQARAEQLKSMPRRLGDLKFTEEDVPVNLGDELPDCLRRVTPGVELLEERFKNLQRRNMLETRQQHKMKRKYKVKVTMKRGHRDELAKIEKINVSE